MKSIYYREQKHICGKSYATAPYMEVDLYPVTPKQHKASRRAKRKEASTLAQQTYNDNRAKRYHVQLVNANFGKGDFSWTGTYDDDHHPEPGDTAKADRDLTNYIKRLYRWCDKNGVQRPKWVAATEYCTMQEDGTACGRHHHHAIIQHTDGLTRDVLEQLWADKAGQIGFTRCEYLDVDHGSVESLVRYISKNKRCARSWRQSRGLEKPKTPPPNDTKWSRKKLDEASIFKSITFDNGTEFAAAEGLERSCVNKRLPRTKVYFCHPYSSWERGTNENTNGMIRRRFPKGTNFAAVTNAQIAQAENWINNYPRKILGYKSSEIVFRECLRELGIAA